MNVLCSDKTGTLTEGVVRINSAIDVNGNDNEKVLLYAYINASYESGFINPIDVAIRNHRHFDISAYKKIYEIPYDFIRKRLSILISKNGKQCIITKGAFQNILAICSSVENAEGVKIPIADLKKEIEKHYETLSNKGFRILGIAYKEYDMGISITKANEVEMTFLGLLVLHDPPKSKIDEIIKKLKNLGISLKIITGDNPLVAAYVGKQVGLTNPRVLTGQDLRHMSDEALINRVRYVDIFAEIEPNQKERIILAFKKSGNVVGYMGDGINDASALHIADVSISVDEAVDVAKDAADIVLLEKDLGVLTLGVLEGRTTFTNTMKYVFMATSANFGNMFSMAVASLFLPFLPLLPKQILLTNLMTDIPEMTISTDTVDPEMIEKPHRWNIKFIRNFMIAFGSLSSIFDFITFGALLYIMHSTTKQFRTAWFVESIISASLIVLVIRSRRPFFKSGVGKYLLTSTLIIVGCTLILPFTPLNNFLEFTPIPANYLLVIGIIIILYIVSAELAKKIFYKREKF